MRAIDDAGIRTTAFMIEAEICVLRRRAASLIEKFDALKEELPYADPVKDRELDRFLIELSRGIMALQSLASLEDSARSMQGFRLPALSETEGPARNLAIENRQLKIKIITPEVAHA